MSSIFDSAKNLNIYDLKEKALLGENFNQINEDGDSPLSIALGHLEESKLKWQVVDFIKTHGGKIQWDEDKNQDHALQLTARFITMIKAHDKMGIYHFLLAFTPKERLENFLNQNLGNLLSISEYANIAGDNEIISMINNCITREKNTAPKKKTITKDNALYLACEEGNLLGVEIFCKKGSKIDVISQNGLTPLSIAQKNGHHDITRLLLFNKSQKDIKKLFIKSLQDNQAYSISALLENCHFLKALIMEEKFIRLLSNIYNEEIINLILNHLETNQFGLFIFNIVKTKNKKLLEIASRNINIDSPIYLEDRSYTTALYLAITELDLKSVKLLLECGANPNLGQVAGDKSLIKCLELAISSSKTEMVNLILKSRAIDQFPQLIVSAAVAAHHGGEKMLRCFEESGIDLSTLKGKQYGRNIIYILSSASLVDGLLNFIDFIKKEYGNKVLTKMINDTETSFNSTPLIAAIAKYKESSGENKKNYQKIIEILMINGANLEITTKDGQNALDYAHGFDDLTNIIQQLASESPLADDFEDDFEEILAT